jgi:hypothetical protein
MVKRRKILLNGEWQLDGRNQVYELTSQNLWKIKKKINF